MPRVANGLMPYAGVLSVMGFDFVVGLRPFGETGCAVSPCPLPARGLAVQRLALEFGFFLLSF